jgi:hypothetical protein
VGWVGGWLGTVLGLVDEVVADEDEDVVDVGDAGGRSQGDVAWWPQPVIAAPATRVTAAQPTTVTRASSMGIPFHATSGEVPTSNSSTAAPEATAKCQHEQEQRR